MSFRDHINKNRYESQNLVHKIASELESIFVKDQRHKSEKNGYRAVLHFSSCSGRHYGLVQIEADEKGLITIEMNDLRELCDFFDDEKTILRKIEKKALPKLTTKVKKYEADPDGGGLYFPSITLEFSELTDSVIKDIMFLMECMDADYRHKVHPTWVESLMETS